MNKTRQLCETSLKTCLYNLRKSTIALVDITLLVMRETSLSWAARGHGSMHIRDSEWLLRPTTYCAKNKNILVRCDQGVQFTKDSYKQRPRARPRPYAGKTQSETLKKLNETRHKELYL